MAICVCGCSNMNPNQQVAEMNAPSFPVCIYSSSKCCSPCSASCCPVLLPCQSPTSRQLPLWWAEGDNYRADINSDLDTLLQDFIAPPLMPSGGLGWKRIATRTLKTISENLKNTFRKLKISVCFLGRGAMSAELTPTITFRIFPPKLEILGKTLTLQVIIYCMWGKICDLLSGNLIHLHFKILY